MTHIYSYPTVYNLGHKAIDGIFSSGVQIEEKIDGSQFSFGIINDELVCRSKGADLVLDAPEKMFIKAIEVVKSLSPQLHKDWIYRAEYLQKPKHNTLAYDRVPDLYLIIFDIATGLETYMSYEDKKNEAHRLGLECVPLLYQGKVENIDTLMAFLNKTSILGGSKIEGIVAKNYSLFTSEKKVMIGKFVSEAFKEVHNANWKDQNPNNKDITLLLIERYRTLARWNKAVQHLRDAGTLENSPRDIGNLMREVQVDIRKECEEEIKEALFKHFWSNIQRGIVAGLPEWWKEELAKQAFGDVK